MGIPGKFSEITNAHIREAATKYIAEEHSPAQTYVVEIDGKNYPIKAIGELASALAGIPLKPDQFTTDEFQSCLVELGFTVHYLFGKNVEVLLRILKKQGVSIWRCATSWMWTGLQMNSVVTMEWLEYQRDYRKNENLTGSGSRAKGYFIKAKSGDIIVLMDKYQYYGIAVVEDGYSFGRNDVMLGERKYPCLRVKYLHAIEKGIDHQFDIQTARPDTFFRLDGLGFKPKQTFKFINESFPGVVENVIDHYQKEETVKQQKIESEINRSYRMNLPLNQILYGPPGTGKTYHTINKALEIIEAKKPEELENEQRQALHDRFDIYLKKGRIAFCTFHQSMSYEDFVEGIKPQEPVNEGDAVNYKIQDGIFKKIAKLASEPVIQSDNFETSYQSLLKEIKNNNSGLVLETLKRSREFVIYENSKGNLKFHANTEIATEAVILKSVVKTYLETGEILDWASYTTSVGQYLISKHGYQKQEEKSDTTLPFVLIIDEINRGNVSQIFGELITLIEEDKRVGKAEALEVLLPYSKTEPFSVPPNLYIIGTMNTADRSVEALDTALRRRFVFEEKAPEPNLLSSKKLIARFWSYDPDSKIKKEEWDTIGWEDANYLKVAEPFFSFLGVNKKKVESKWPTQESWNKLPLVDGLRKVSESDFDHLEPSDFTGINLELLLTTINARIEVLLSKDHQIGHSYFMKVYSEEDLKTAFYKSIIPLLQEYFYGDYGKIGLVLGRGFVTTKMIEKPATYFDFPYDGHEELASKAMYEIVDYRKTTEENPSISIQLTKDKKLNFSFLDAIRRITGSNYEPKQ